MLKKQYIKLHSMQASEENFLFFLPLLTCIQVTKIFHSKKCIKNEYNFLKEETFLAH